MDNVINFPGGDARKAARFRAAIEDEFRKRGVGGEAAAAAAARLTDESNVFYEALERETGECSRLEVGVALCAEQRSAVAAAAALLADKLKHAARMAWLEARITAETDALLAQQRRR